MTTLELLSTLRKLGVEITVEEEKLRLNAPKGAISAELREEIAAHKQEILAFLRSAMTTEGTTEVHIPVYPRTGPVPLSYSQERLWFLEQLSPGNYAYNMPGAVRLRGFLNLDCFEQALNEILARHEVLRTNFSTSNDQPIQIIQPARTLPVAMMDLSALSPDEQLIEAKRLTEEEAKRPFDLTKDLLVRATLLKLSEDDHIFLLTIHHIVTDGWSRGIFTREFIALYEAFTAGRPNPLHPLPIQYADFAQWQREWLQGERLDTQLNYWRQQLAGDLPQLDLLLDKPRPPVQSLNSGKATFQLPASLAQSLRRLSQEEDATLYMTLLAAFKLLLHRYTGVEDITVGSPIAGRNHAELENLIGFFINTLVLRTDLSGNPSFRELIRRIKKTALDAYTHQDIPFEKLLIELHPERNLSRTPFFQIFFNMLNLEDGRTEVPGLSAEVFDIPDIGSKFDLTLYLMEKNQSIDLLLVYNTDLFTPERIDEILQQYHDLLAQIVEHAGMKLDAYSLVTRGKAALLPDPTAQLDATWHQAVHEQFSKNARRHPASVAVVDKDGQWTYEQLEGRTNQLAHFLRAKGLESQQIVAVYGHRSAALVWAIMGILKAGGAFLILDPAYPVARQLDYLNIAQPRGFIQLQAAGEPHAELEAWLKENVSDCRVMLPRDLPSQYKGILNDYPVHYPDIPIGPEDLAGISFTSGSTGKPKGVAGRHGPLSHFLPWQSEIFQLSENDRFSMLSGLSHDPLQRDIFTALWVGASVHIPDPEQVGTPGWLNQWMRREQISFSHFTPAMAQLLTTSSSTADLSDRQLPSLRYAFFVGDKLTRHDVDQLGQLAPNVICINSYGSTETQRAVGYLLVDPKDTSQVGHNGQQGKSVIPVGRGMKDVQLLILTANQQLAGVGELGEIHVRSPHLARGYLHDDALTQEKFIINPFTNAVGDRLYKSGDLGRFLPDGKVEFLGRKDTQVKIRGFRIELGEIENTLNEHPAVRQAVIDVWTPGNDDKRLVAYVVPRQQDYQKANELQEYLREHLPAHMIPSNIMFLPAIPITPNGKINRAALPRPGSNERGLDQEQINARNDIEKELVRIWQDLLHTRKIGVKDNFFELGGHSLMAVHMFTRIAEKFNTNLPLSTLFQEATIEHLARVIHRSAEPVAWSSLIEIEPAGDHPPFFCIHGITGDVLWFRDLAKALAPDYPFYGLQARGLDGIQEPFSQVEAMAAFYIEEMRLRQPKGPYFLGGASLGGTVALEIAQQLLRQGEEVALLAIFDHFPRNVTVNSGNGKFTKGLVSAAKVAKNFPNWFGEFMQLDRERMLMRIRRKLKIARKLREQPDVPDTERFDAEDLIDFAPELSAHRHRVITSHYQAMNAYQPGPYRGRVTLFRAKSRPLLNTNDPEVVWQKLAPGNTHVVDIPGSHEGMFKIPQVNYLAEKLRNCMDQALENNSQQSVR
ncbi:MAG TPA: amino acid adenylation domain-containing protein [Anaerolineales bacterium]|nr:amino acid adenylation domain-containing protein [Anaerolineales bacterium]